MTADTIILVDDDAAVRSALTFAFELEGFRVQAHASGETLGAAELPDRGCLVLDYELPGMNGLDLLHALRARAVDLPAILTATQPRRALRLAAEAAGVAIVEKPLLADALLDGVRDALARRMRTEIDEAGIGDLVDRFYAKVRRDPEIGPVFNAAVHDWDEHLATLRDFWSSVMLTSGRYKGDPLGTHRKHPAIAPEMFDRWLALWAETSVEIFAPEAAALFQMKAARIAESLKLGLFFRPDRARA